MSALELVQRITRFRPELDVYILIAQEKEDDVVDKLFTESVDGYFYREERDYRGIYRILNAQIQERARTPFYDQLKNYVWMAKDQWHTPGHSSGESLRGSPWVNDFYEFMGEHVFDADLSVSVPMLDSLMEPKGVIAEAQAMAAKAFGARRTYFATNGTSTANKVILQTLLAPGEKLLLDRNCHKSVHHGVVLSGAHPIYLDSALNRKYGLYGPVPKKTLLNSIKKHPDAQALILTSCTYDGLRYDLAPIVDAAHAKGIKVIIDEAWYGFARFHPEFRPTALEAGADYATQSTHKVLSAFSQASMIHINDPGFREHLFRENFNMHTSTSPQYGLIASLDVARKQAMMEGYKLLSRTLELANEVRNLINSTRVFRVLELDDLLPDEVRHDGIRLDPTKVTIDISGCGYTVDDLQKLLFERYNIQVEKSTFNTLTLLLTIGTTRSKLSRLYDSLMRIARESRAPRRLVQTPEIPAFTRLRYLPRDAYYCGGELVPVFDERERVNKQLAGRICADQIVPYPPGIPVLVPGQLITSKIVDYIADLLHSHKRMEMHGVVHEGYLPCIRVLRPEEEKSLRRLR
jgi:arginine decarboxylase